MLSLSMETQGKVLANPGFYYKFSPIHGILQYLIRFIRVLSDSLMNQVIIYSCNLRNINVNLLIIKLLLIRN